MRWCNKQNPGYICFAYQSYFYLQAKPSGITRESNCVGDADVPWVGADDPPLHRRHHGHSHLHTQWGDMHTHSHTQIINFQTFSLWSYILFVFNIEQWALKSPFVSIGAVDSDPHSFSLLDPGPEGKNWKITREECQQLRPVLIVLELAPLTPRKIKRRQNHPGNS